VLHRLTLGLGLQDPSEDDVYFIMNELDVNGDRKLSRSEFTNLGTLILNLKGFVKLKINSLNLKNLKSFIHFEAFNSS
jgi:hypothetical protein